MRSPLSTICLLLILGRTACVSADIYGYNCDSKFFPDSELIEAATQARTMSRLKDPGSMRLKQLSRVYSGPPFTEPYLLWPIFDKLNNFNQATHTPYRVVLTENFEVFSVMMTNGNNFRECKRREDLNLGYVNSCHYECGKKYFRNKEIKKAADAACPQLRASSTRRFPARYNGEVDAFLSGTQLYLFPLLEFGIYDHSYDPEFAYLVLNSECQIVTVLHKKGSSYRQCIDANPMPVQKIDEE